MTDPTLAERHPWIAWVVPFAVFMLLLGVVPGLGLPARLDAALRVGVPALAILLVARPALDFGVARPLATVGVGIAVFALWIGPDLLVPGYRAHVLFQNALTGTTESGVPAAVRSDPVILSLRFLRGAMVVPIVEELFWRGWLPRWLDRPDDFRAQALGSFTRFSFWATAVLFALEHGAYWDVGFLAGLIYNWWMTRTRRIGDLILCHAVTNACLGVYVLMSGRWGYW